MSLSAEVIQDLEQEIFSVIGKSVTFISHSSPVYNDRGEQESSTKTTSTITVVPYDIYSKTMNQSDMGNLEEGSTYFAIKHDQTVNLNDEIIMEGITYVVQDISPNYLPENVVNIIRATKQQP